MADHALLSASSAYRWLECTPAPRLEAQFQDSQSLYALEGIVAHSLAEHCLKHGVKAHLVFCDDVPDLLLLAEVYPDEKERQEALRAMRRYVQEYVDYVESFPGTAFSEVRVDFSHLVPEGFGTSDRVVMDNKTLHVMDLKYGKGKKVMADTPQTKLYALGALKKFEAVFEDVEGVVLHIHQPRLGHVDVHEMTRAELEAWGERYVKPRAEIAFKGLGEYKPGDHCDFCRARHSCRARAEENLKTAFDDFAEPCPKPALLTIEEIAQLLPKLDQISKWTADVSEFALSAALEGTPIPGYKVVEGRSVRKWVDEVRVADAMRAEGLSNEQIYSMKIIGLTEAEKLLGKKSEVFELAERVPGKPALVPESDKRQPLNVSSAARDFAESEAVNP